MARVVGHMPAVVSWAKMSDFDRGLPQVGSPERRGANVPDLDLGQVYELKGGEVQLRSRDGGRNGAFVLMKFESFFIAVRFSFVFRLI